MADRPRPATKRFKSSKIRVHTKSTRGRTIKRNVAVKISKFSHTPTLSEPRSPVIEDNLEEPSCDSVVEINSEKPFALSKYHRRRVKEYSSWEAIRESLLQLALKKKRFPARLCASNALPILLFVDVWSVARDSSFARIAQSWFMKRETTFTFSRDTRFLCFLYCISFALLYIFKYGKNQPARATIID